MQARYLWSQYLFWIFFGCFYFPVLLFHQDAKIVSRICFWFLHMTFLCKIWWGDLSTIFWTAATPNCSFSSFGIVPALSGMPPIICSLVYIDATISLSSLMRPSTVSATHWSFSFSHSSIGHVSWNRDNK